MGQLGHKTIVLGHMPRAMKFTRIFDMKNEKPRESKEKISEEVKHNVS